MKVQGIEWREVGQVSARPTETKPLAVEHIVEGMLVDLASCPFLKTEPVADCEFALVAGVEAETPDCVAIWYDSIDQVGYPMGTLLEVVLA
jgi:hypothetical protein